MQNSDPNLTDFRTGDKVRVRTGLYVGARGTICGREMGLWQVQLNEGEVQTFHSEELTNYSLAARRAWANMPKRAGRPASEKRKKMVSVRIDTDLWEQLGEAVEKGLIPSREQMINKWLRESLSQFLADELT